MPSTGWVGRFHAFGAAERRWQRRRFLLGTIWPPQNSAALLGFAGGEEGRFHQVGGLRPRNEPLGCVARDRGLDAGSFSVVARGQAAALRERLGSKGAGTTVRG
jgi:hypothetical protein